MQIVLVNCVAKLQAQGIDVSIGSGVDALCSRLQSLLPLDSFGYGFANDTLTIEIPDGTTVPDMSDFGDVAVV